MSDLNPKLSAITAAFNQAVEIVITAHERPDGDALGSCLGLARLLKAAGKRARVVGLQDIPPRYRFMVKPNEIEAVNITPAKDWLGSADLLVVLDCVAFDRPGEFVLGARDQVRIVNIDHHDSNTMFGDLNWVDKDASSAGEMVFHLAEACKWKISQEVAEPIWVALATDTGRFVYENTSAETLRIAAQLVEAGARPYALYSEIYLSLPLKEMKLQQRALASMQVRENGKVAFVCLSNKDFAELECGPENAQDVVNLSRKLQGVKVGIFFYELAGRKETKVSVRADDPCDATDLCRAFGGGGHHRAAGCTVKGGLKQAVPVVLTKVHELWFGR